MNLYVSTEGNNSWSGRLPAPNATGDDGPLATLEAARDTIRALKKRDGLPSGGITVWVRSGVYLCQTTFALTADDSGAPDAPIIYRAYESEQPRFVGGREIAGFQPVTDPAVLARLDPAARSHVLQADLRAQGIQEFGRLRPRGFSRLVEPAPLELFFMGEPMSLARWPNEGWARINDAPGGEQTPYFTFTASRLQRWTSATDAWVHGYWRYGWADSYERVKEVDTEKRMITTYGVGPYGFSKGARFYILNLLEELDAAGEWYLDRESGLLYFWPPKPIEQGQAMVSLLEEPMVTLTDASYITLQGLTFECTRGHGVVIVGGRHNLIQSCTFRNIGNIAVCIGEGAEQFQTKIYDDPTWDRNGGTANGVVGCTICHCGEGGILLGGGNRRVLTPAGNYATDNEIYNSNRLARTYRPAIGVDGVGNLVAHNLIHDLPHFAIWLHGNDHVIEFNEIHHVCLETNDAGAFYMGRDFSERGNLVRYNYFHELGEGDLVQAVYLDDCASGTLVYGNIFRRAGRGVMIGGGRDNTVENNIFVDCRPAVHIDARGKGWASFWFDGRDNTLLRRLHAVRHDHPPYSERYPELITLLADDPAFPKGNRVLRNICVGGRWLDLLDGLRPDQFEIRDNLTEDDPGLVAPRAGDFRLREGARALQLGFQPIPFERIGPRH